MMADYILSSYREIFKVSSDEVSRIGDDIPIPAFNAEDIAKLLILMNQILIEQETLIIKKGKYVVVGDIHGNLHDLIRIFQHYGFPPKAQYIFLGDYVDRGEYYLEVVVLLFAFMIKYPEKIILLRGNHEFSKINKMYGFHTDIMRKFSSDDIFEDINRTFDILPLACLLNDNILLVQAGIPSLSNLTLEDIAKVRRPISEYSYTKVITNLMWADPIDSDNLNGIPNSRGMGEYFGKNHFMYFLNTNKLACVIRGHQCVNGVQVSFDNKLITVFSSSNYHEGNCIGAILIPGGESDIFIMPPIKYPRAVDAFYFNQHGQKEHSKLSTFATIQKFGRSACVRRFSNARAYNKLTIPKIRKAVCSTGSI